jgi:hypothetical protein
MLCLRRGTVIAVERAAAGERGTELLEVDVAGASRPAFADVGMVGSCLVGDDVVVNTEAVDLALGSGGRDVVMVNLTRGLEAEVEDSRRVMKLNYSPMQACVDPIEPETFDGPIGLPVGVFQLHGHLAPVVWAAKRERPELRIGYVQTGGGALPGAFSNDVAELRERELLADHLTAAPAYGGEGEAMTTIGALHAGLTERGWDCAVVGPGPGIIGSGTALGHGGMVALDSAHAALALGCPTVLVARASSGDKRERHQGVSHHTRSTLKLLLAPVTVGLGKAVPLPPELEGHRWVRAEPELGQYAESGLSRRTMGRDLVDDPMFFEQALAGGIALARSVS